MWKMYNFPLNVCEGGTFSAKNVTWKGKGFDLGVETASGTFIYILCFQI